ncbi:hypothetical protein SAMN05444583_10792 [Rhodococcus maanshanensis]|uniref:Uncharacterized protein n=1 Tax=Rhodococcus maanshanensis TaxID=183556 RepID=A0A1H7NMX3_9NOCA|nr:hypothetical protein SAMN05444583_10792 [Rhodococcus maanshanensis]
MQSSRVGYQFRITNYVHEEGPRLRLRNVNSKRVDVSLTPDEAYQLQDSLSDCLDEHERNELRNCKGAGR